MDVTSWVAIIGLLVTFATMLSTALYKVGHLSARVEALESWRASMRQDMHEISETLTEVVTELKSLHTMIEERTNRRRDNGGM